MKQDSYLNKLFHSWIIISKDKVLPMKNFEIFDRIINGDMRPHKFPSDGNSLKMKINKLKITHADILNYFKCIGKYGENYYLTISNPETGETIRSECENIDFQKLIDINLKSETDKKGALYFRVIEISYFKNLALIEKKFHSDSETSLRAFANKTILKLKILWQDLENYKKLIIADKEQDYQKSDDFIIVILLKSFLQRTFIDIMKFYKPYIEKKFLKQSYNYFFPERDEELKYIDPVKISEESTDKKINFRQVTKDFFNEIIQSNQLDINRFDFVSAAKKKLFVKIAKENNIKLSGRNRESIRSYLSKLKSEHVKQKKPIKRK